MTQPDVTSVHGMCTPEFDLVREEFARNLAERGEAGAAVALSVNGETVVDLWGGIAYSARPWQQDTTVVVWSCTKGATALCAAWPKPTRTGSRRSSPPPPTRNTSAPWSGRRSPTRRRSRT